MAGDSSEGRGPSAEGQALASAGCALSRDAVAAGLARALPGFAELLSLDRLSGGANQETYRLVVRTEPDGDERPFALRRSRGGAPLPRLPGQPGLRAEARILRAAHEVGVPVPQVIWLAEPGDGIGEAFVMEWLEGETLGKRINRSEEFATARARLARECGEVLARIHSIDLASSGLEPILDRMDPAAYLEGTYDRYCSYDTPQPMIDYTARWLREHLPAPTEPALVHNDFRNGNLMIAPSGLVGVLDWELAHIGDPMRDLGWLCTNSWRFGTSELPVGGFGHYDDLFAGYESVSGRPIDRERVRYWEVFGSFWWAVGCLEMAAYYRSGSDATVERPGIGRRSSECQVDCANLLIPGPVELLDPASSAPSAEMPRIDELIESVSHFLRKEVLSETQGRTRFLARVAANSLGIAARDHLQGPPHRKAQLHRLQAIFASREADLEALQRRLAQGLRSGDLPLNRQDINDYLRESTARQLAIDQPTYGGLKTALKNKT